MPQAASYDMTSCQCPCAHRNYDMILCCCADCSDVTTRIDFKDRVVVGVKRWVTREVAYEPG